MTPNSWLFPWALGTVGRSLVPCSPAWLELGNIQHCVVPDCAVSDDAVGTLPTSVEVGGGHCHGSWPLEPPALAVMELLRLSCAEIYLGRRPCQGGLGAFPASLRRAQLGSQRPECPVDIWGDA